jgi:hypothetical protein
MQRLANEGVQDNNYAPLWSELAGNVDGGVEEKSGA